MLENDERIIHDMTNTEQYDYEAIHADVCPDPATLTKGQRDNRAWPTVQNMIDFLTLLHSVEWQESKGSTPVNEHKQAYFQALNNQLLSAPFKVWANGSAQVKHRLTSKGRAYLCWLKVTHHKSKPLRALTVVKATCSAVVVAGHWERLGAVDMIEQARDAMYTVCLRERANTYSMITGMAI
jgi:hypothetical protein